ncbi:Uncharacterised protein [Mycobacteroides abscessus subsp. abscessus]|nr:Uncharacterised protein [Mycobacteroides abscessus subsp. abscessus]
MNIHSKVRTTADNSGRAQPSTPLGSRNPGWSPGYGPSRRTGAVAATLGPSGIAIVTFGYHVSNNPARLSAAKSSPALAYWRGVPVSHDPIRGNGTGPGPTCPPRAS